jgi:hypothetical protein
MTTKSAKLKCVVFSQFFGVMDVAAEELTVQGIGFLGIDDDMKQYRIEPTLSWSFHPIQMQGVLLLSMRCGAFGLTLTAADHCFIMDIAQYSAIEEQAIDRIHRIGQLNPVTEKLHKSVGSMSKSVFGDLWLSIVPRRVRTLYGASALATRKLSRPAKSARTTYNLGDSTSTRQQRVDMLEKLFGCTS